MLHIHLIWCAIYATTLIHLDDEENQKHAVKLLTAVLGCSSKKSGDANPIDYVFEEHPVSTVLNFHLLFCAHDCLGYYLVNKGEGEKFLGALH